MPKLQRSSRSFIHDDVKHFFGLLHPLKGVGVDDGDLGAVESIAVECLHAGHVLEQVGPL